MRTRKEEHLGDGLYVSCDGFHIKLRAPREEGDHVVFLEDWMVKKFAKFCEEVT